MPKLSLSAPREAAALTAAAVEARMSGISLPVMSSGGSGNCGIGAVVAAARSEGISDRALIAGSAEETIRNVGRRKPS